MTGEKRFYAIAGSLIVILALVAYLVTFLALWEYRAWVALGGGVLLGGLIVLGAVVKAKGALNEQRLRHKRVLYRAELPLDEAGTPYYLPADAQAHQQATRPAVYQTVRPKEGYGGYYETH